LPYVYLGYYIAASPKMNYKTKFKSAEILSNGSWTPLADIASP
jgi:arginyl-tRNA--protein-N-Asp/Glu arginylyltransferase